MAKICDTALINLIAKKVMQSKTSANILQNYLKFKNMPYYRHLNSLQEAITGVSTTDTAVVKNIDRHSKPKAPCKQEKPAPASAICRRQAPYSRIWQKPWQAMLPTETQTGPEYR
jgi:hypothetical protein